jgi:hypothetical protein
LERTPLRHGVSGPNTGFGRSAFRLALRVCQLRHRLRPFNTSPDEPNEPCAGSSVAEHVNGTTLSPEVIAAASVCLDSRTRSLAC